MKIKYLIDENELLIAIKNSLTHQLSCFWVFGLESRLLAAAARNVAMAAMAAGIEYTGPQSAIDLDRASSRSTCEACGCPSIGLCADCRGVR